MSARLLLSIENSMRHDIAAVAAEYVLECFRLNTSPRVDELARKLQVHPSFLSRHFKTSTGRRLSAALKEHQIAEAKRLLSHTSMTIDQIAAQAGFGTRNTFYRYFKRVVGTTPQRYRAKSCK